MAPQFPNATNQIIMDSKLIQQYGEEILCYRLRTARQKKRMQYDDFDKQLIQMHKEKNILYEQERNLGWEPLVPPVQKGWKRFFVLKDDVERSKNAEFFKAILKKINTYEWSYRKNFLVRRRKRGKKIYVVKGQKLLEPCPSHFAKLGFNDAQKQMFHEVFRYDKSRRMTKRYVFNEPWRFVLRVRPNMITRVKANDSLIEARMRELDSYLERNNLKWKQIKLLEGNCRRRHRDWDNYKETYAFENWPLERILDQLIEEL